MSYPHPYPPPDCPAPPPPRKRISPVDVVVTVIVSVTLIALAVVALSFEWLLAMLAVPGCGATGKCRDDLIIAAYAVAWGGMGVSLLVPLIGVPIAAVKRTMMWVWPSIGVVLLVVATIGGIAIFFEADVTA